MPVRCEQGILVRDLENDEVIDPGRVTAVVLAAFERGVGSLDKLLWEGKVFANEQVVGVYLQHDDLLSKVVYDHAGEKLQENTLLLCFVVEIGHAAVALGRAAAHESHAAAGGAVGRAHALA